MSRLIKHVEKAREQLLGAHENVLAASRVEPTGQSGRRVAQQTGGLLGVLVYEGAKKMNGRKDDEQTAPQVLIDARRILIRTDQRLIIAKDTVRTSKAEVLQEWSNADVVGFAATSSLAGKKITVSFADGSELNVARVDGSKLDDWGGSK